jgi:hypothetical protein
MRESVRRLRSRGELRVNREWVLFHLAEARDELTKTMDEIRDTPDYGYGEFSAAMQHLYYHVNTAWNSWDATEAQVKGQTGQDFTKWAAFPTDLPMMEG